MSETGHSERGVWLAPFVAGALLSIPDEERPLVERALLAPARTARDGDLAGLIDPPPADALAFLLVEGVVFKETVVAGNASLEVLTEGDLLAAHVIRSDAAEARQVRYLAHGPVSLAVLGERFRAASRRWPALMEGLHDQLARQADRTSGHLAMLHASRVEDRVMLLLADLGERCGRMTPRA